MFETRRRVEFGDTDMAGIVHFSQFFRYMEAAETDFLLARGLSVSFARGGESVGFPRVSASCDYKLPAKFGDTLTVAVAVENVGGKSVTYRHEFRRGADLVAVGRITAVFARKLPGGGIEALPVPPDVRAALLSPG